MVRFALVWCVSPIDLTGIIPVAGPLDDVIVAGLVVRHVLRRTDREVVDATARGALHARPSSGRVDGRRRHRTQHSGPDDPSRSPMAGPIVPGVHSARSRPEREDPA